MGKTKAAPNLNTYTPKERNMYLLGLAGQNMIYNIIGVGLQWYFESVIFLPAMAIGWIMTLGRIWDAINDPMMGTIADRTRTKWGKFRPYLLFVPLPIFIVTTLCFTSFGIYGTELDGNHVAMLIWCGFMYVLWTMVYTVGDIPVWGITAVMTENPDDRNKLLSLARIAATLGGGVTLIAITPVGTNIGNMLSEKVFNAKLGEKLGILQGQRYGFLIAAGVFALIGCGLFELVGIFTRERIHPSAQKTSFKQNLGIMWNNKPFRQILISGILSSPRNLVMLVVFTLINYYFANGDDGAMIGWYIKLGLGLAIGMGAAYIFMPKIVEKFEKKKVYNISNFVTSIPFVLIFVFYEVAPNHDVTGIGFIILYNILFAFAGFSLAAQMVLQSLMIADCIDYEEYRSGIRPDGVFFAGQSFITKLCTGLATLICEVAYWAVKFDSAEKQQVVVYMKSGAGLARQNPAFEPYMMIMFFLISIPPAIACILSALPTLHYALPDAEHNKMVEMLNAKRHAAENGSAGTQDAVTDDSSSADMPDNNDPAGGQQNG